jgi:hypothetical protein
MKSLAQICLFTILGSACVADEPLVSEDTAELGPHGKILIQPGTDQILLGVTDDNFAVYQQGQSLYATKLVPGAPRLYIAEVPGTNIPQPLQVGDVMFLWTNPQRNVPGFGVSPLIAWTAKQGTQLISAQSAVGLVATAASSDSRQLVFTTNVTNDGLRGDLVHAFTNDALHARTLLANIPLNFPNGQCRPLASFGRDHGHDVPVAVYCAGSDTTATLSKWTAGGTKVDLIANILTPLPFILESDADANTFLVNLANDSVATVTMRGNVTIVDPAARSRQGFVGRHGTVGYVALTPTAPPELRLAERGDAPEPITEARRIYTGTYNRSGYSKPRAVSSDSLVLFGSIIDASTNLSDMNLLDVRTGDVLPLETAQSSNVYSENFTSNGRYGLYFRVSDPTSNVATLVAADRDGTHTIGPVDGVWDALAATGSDVSFNTNPILDFSSFRAFFLWTGDLFVADAAHPHREPRQIATQASLLYFPSHDRRNVVFSSTSEADGPGVYLASARR